MSAEPEARYAPAAVARLTGVSAHALRAWERRYGAVAPARTPGGARRYSEKEVTRLRLLRQAVDAGHPISDVAKLPNEEVTRRLGLAAPARRAEPGPGRLPLDEILESARELDFDALQQALSLQLAALGPRGFAHDVASPLLRRIGEEWVAGTLSISAEHAATATVRNLLGSSLRRESAGPGRPMILFTTPAGERRELGALMAAVEGFAAGAQVAFLGADLPVEELVAAAERVGARAVALSIVGLEPEPAERELRALRDALPADVEIFVGGAGATALALPLGVEIIHHLEELQGHVARLN